MVGEQKTIPVKNTKPVATQPTETTPQVTPVTGEPKKSIFKKWWLWVIIILVLGAAAYFLFL